MKKTVEFAVTRFGTEKNFGGKSTVGSNGHDADMDMRVGFVEMTLTIHDVFFSVATLEEVKGIAEILFTCVAIELEHEIDGSGNNDVFNTDGIGARTLFQMQLGDTFLDAST